MDAGQGDGWALPVCVGVIRWGRQDLILCQKDCLKDVAGINRGAMASGLALISPCGAIRFERDSFDFS
jgi:hypothetical protein